MSERRDSLSAVLIGNCEDLLRSLEPASVHCCVTSPPYYGLRDYGEPEQLGLEATPEAYVERLVGVFRSVRRVLRDDGTLWLNLGDSYATGAGRVATAPGGGEQGGEWEARGALTAPNRLPLPGLKPKDLIGIPWRVALALQADGWYLRQDIIWHKPNAMPESVRDRCTKAHEYMFLLSKAERYHFDHEAMREPSREAVSWSSVERFGGSSATRNRRSVWTVPTKRQTEVHFATFPPELIEPCILAGCPEGGLVLDPFAGSGTAGVVAVARARRFLGCELSAEYAELARRRIEEAAEAAGLIGAEDAPDLEAGTQLGMASLYR